MHRSHTLVSALLMAISLATTMAGQSGSGSAGVYGPGIAGKGGFTPRAWIDGQPSVGNNTFKVTIDRGLGGANAGMFLSAKPADIPFLNLRLLVDLSPALSVGPILAKLGGGAGVGGAGAVQLQLPIPNNGNLVGTSAYFQWLVADGASPSGLVSTNGLRVTISVGSLVFAGGTGLVEFVPGGTSTSAGPSGKGISDMHFDRTGSMALVAAGSSVVLYDMSVRPRKVLASAAMGGTVNCFAVHPNQERAYVVLPHRTAPKVQILDIKRGSTTFGKLIGTVSKLPTTGLADMEGCSISAEGNVLAIAVMGLVGTKGVVIVDVDPASSTRDQYKKTVPVTIGSFVTDVDVSPTGGTVYVCSGNLGPGSVVGMIDVASGLLLKSVGVGDFAVDIDADPLGRFLVVATPNSKQLAHVDLTTGPNFFKATRFPTTTARFFSVALTPDGSQAIAIGNGSPADIHAFDTATRKSVWSVKNSVSGAAIAVR